MKTSTKTLLGITTLLAATAVVQADERAPAIGATVAGTVASGSHDALRPLPAYPIAALRRGERHGRVLIDYDVAPDGAVQGVRVLSAYPMQVFTRTSVDAVRGWRHGAGSAGPRQVEFTFQAD